jgi:hypothetical protein
VRKKFVVCPVDLKSRVANPFRWDPTTLSLWHPIGEATQVVNVADVETGEVHHETIVYLSRRAELHVIVRDDGHIGLLYQRREKVVPPDIAEKIFNEDPSRLPGIEHVMGIEEYECPHGLSIKPLAEAEEETGYAIIESWHIGFVKDAPARGGAPHFLYATKIGRDLSGKKPETTEQIMRVEFFPPEEVCKIQTICALTQAALWRFRCWGLAQDQSSFWYSVARRL